MFETSQSSHRSENTRNALISVVVHAVVFAACVVVPLTRIAALPGWTSTTGLEAPARPVEDDPIDSIEVVDIGEVAGDGTIVPSLDRGSIIGPTTIPSEIAALVDEIGVARRDRTLPAIRKDSTGTGIGVIGAPGARPGIGAPPPPPPPPPPPRPPADPEPQRIRVSAGVIQGHLVERVAPNYPSLARAARITGTVTLEGVIDTEGHVTELRVVEGHPLLTGAAIDAVRQWRYEPYLLNGKPVDVVTLFSIVFRMD